MILPDGWVVATIEDLSSEERRSITDGPFGSALKSEHYTSAGARVIRLNNIGSRGFIASDAAFVSPERFETLRAHEAKAGDLVTAALGEPLGRTCSIPDDLGDAIVKADCFRLRPTSHVDSRYLLALLNSPDTRKSFAERGRGIGRVRINLEVFRSTTIPVAPAAEQRRIVAKLDALTARLSRARAKLDRVPVLAGRLRNEALSKAVVGQLVRGGENESWSKDERDAISAQREAYLGARRGSRLRNGLGSTLDWLAGERSGWLDCCLADVVNLRVGHAFKSADFQKGGGVPLLRGANVAPGAVDWTNQERLPKEIANNFAQYTLSKGDIVIAMDRPIISSGLKVAQVEDDSEGALLVQRVANPKPTRWILADYLLTILRSRLFIEQIEEHSTGSDLPHISANDILTTPAPLPPLAVQRRICDAVTSVFVRADRLEAEAARARALLDRLESAILAKAFRGELVPQEPNDEPASVLLDRIRAQRNTAPKPKRGRRAATAVG